MSNKLFRGAELLRYIEGNKQALVAKIGALSEERMHQTARSVLCENFVLWYMIEALVIDEDKIRTDYSDAEIDVSQHPNNPQNRMDGPALVDGTQITYFVPFTDTDQLLQCKPSRHGLDGGVQAERRDDEIVFVYSRTPQETAEIKDVFRHDLAKLKKYLKWSGDEVEQHNETLEALVDQCVSARRVKVRKR